VRMSVRSTPDLLLHPLAQDFVPGAQSRPRSDAPGVGQAGVHVLVREYAVVEAKLQSGEDLGLARVRVGVVCQCREVGRTARRSPGGLVRVTVRVRARARGRARALGLYRAIGL
jgi:hypothetical protein